LSAPLLVLIELAFPTLGALVIARHPRNAVGWLIYVGGLAETIRFTTKAVGSLVEVRGDVLSLGYAMSLLHQEGHLLAVPLLTIAAADQVGRCRVDRRRNRLRRLLASRRLGLGIDARTARASGRARLRTWFCGPPRKHCDRDAAPPPLRHRRDHQPRARLWRDGGGDRRALHVGRCGPPGGAPSHHPGRCASGRALYARRDVAA